MGFNYAFKGLKYLVPLHTGKVNRIAKKYPSGIDRVQ